MEGSFILADEARGDGIRFVHRDDCQVAPAADRATGLGTFDDCEDAMQVAREHSDRVDGCAHCCPDCHTLSGDG